MPLNRRLPKRGFTNIFRKEYTTINVSELERFPEGTVITAEFLKNEGVIAKIAKYGLKVLGNGELTKALTVKAAAFTESATQKIQTAGGKIEVI